MRRPLVLLLCAALFVAGAPGQSALGQLTTGSAAPVAAGKTGPALSGAAEMRDTDYGTGLTECPQAGLRPQAQPRPLDRRRADQVEQRANGGNDQRVNHEYSCFPQNETSIDVNPLDPRNAVAGANDYRLGWGASGVFATTDNGTSWYAALTPFPSVPSGDDHIDGGGDPAIVYDRAGVVYYAQIRFDRLSDENGIFVNRSTNGGFTWSRPCASFGTTDAEARCGAPGDPRHPGDGTVTYWPDPDRQLNGSAPFDDKEYIAAGPRPAGVEPVCFTPVERAPQACPEGTVGVDRLYVTWTRFEDDPTALFGFTAQIMLSYSDDRARSWSPARPISGSAPFCAFSVPAERCDLNQFSVPTVHPVTGLLGVAFENYNTPDENQYLFVRSRDGGTTFEGPFFVTPVFDVNYPSSGITRPDCQPRGQQTGRNVLTNSCFRVNSAGAVVFDPRGGAFADDLYLVMSDNRNGTPASSNTDVFFFRSLDGGSTWVGPTRVNDDPSTAPADRDCDPSAPGCAGTFGNDQWFPWVDVSSRGDVNVAFYDRRLDTDSVASEWPTSRQKPGNYLVWRFGAVCTVTATGAGAAGRECVAPEAAPIPQPTGPVNPGSGPQPGGIQTVFPFRNFTVSDVPSNWDYTFRNGIFAGDYDVVAIGADHTAWSVWTDARNGRSSRNQPGRNPACEQADAFVDRYSAASGGSVDRPRSDQALFLVTPCPTDVADPARR